MCKNVALEAGPLAGLQKLVLITIIQLSTSRTDDQIANAVTVLLYGIRFINLNFFSFF